MQRKEGICRRPQKARVHVTSSSNGLSGRPAPSVRVFIDAVGARAEHDDQSRLLRCLAERDEVGRHCVVPRAADAEILLTVFHRAGRTAFRYNDPRRVGYCSHDVGWPLLPGLYPSLPRWNAHPRFARAAAYLPRIGEESLELADAVAPRHLFSFVGNSRTWDGRRQLLALAHPGAFLRDTAGHPAYRANATDHLVASFRQDYRRALADSWFVLCPRGNGASSMRLFETMRAGRAPVIISDDWVPPRGIPWDTFALRVPEDRIVSIPALLEAESTNARERGLRAREAYRSNFGERRIFDYLIEQSAEMVPTSPWAFRAWQASHLLDPRNRDRKTLASIFKA